MRKKQLITPKGFQDLKERIRDDKTKRQASIHRPKFFASSTCCDIITAACVVQFPEPRNTREWNFR